MKTREFDIKNYKDKIVKKAYEIICKQMTIELKGLKFTPKASRYSFDGIDIATLEIDAIFGLFNDNDGNNIKQELLQEFELQKEKTMKNFEETKKIADAILFDDKDYIDLLVALENIYYCQANTMINDVLEQKLKGKTAKAIKYQARKMALINKVVCD